ncbi:hypothetical protein CP532_1698 [Ophiocordyceps camponoti-leonardi (nom. inval.)]|nr:hypothetical protein CP532_1698 [Ophiocordyceps camponoti-leonardi (nom. inval.)]
MPPVEIADSDDDDGSDSPLTPENDELITVSAQTRSSDRASHATTSTDPVLFQRVFDEQREAAHQSALNEQRREAHHPTGSDRCDENTSAASIESLTGPDAWSSTNTGERQCSSTRKRQEEGAAAMAEAKDMWDVPSSPERNAGSRISRTKSRQATTVKITRGLRRNVEMLGYESDEDAGRTKRDAKKRRLQSSNDDDPDTPIKERSLNAATISTMTIDDRPPLCIATKPLSESQKEEYESVRGSQTNTVAKEETGSKGQHSSGTATNLNTPRDHDVPSREEGPGSTQGKRRTRARRDSSPDVIALDRGDGGGLRGCDASSKGDDVEMLPPRRQDEQDDDESDFGESMAKAKQKKKRGRPSKKAVAPEPLKAKRGRPKKKKAEEAVQEEEEEQALEETVDLCKVSPSSPPPPSALPSATASAAPLALQQEDDEEEEEKEEGKEEAGQGKVQQQDKPKSQDDPQPHPHDHPHPPPPLKPTKTNDSKPPKEPKEQADKTVSPHNPKQPSLGGNKPIYRIGLSKKLRIQPLLKSLPK